MMEFDVREVDYTEYSNRQLAAVPLAVLALAILILVGWSLFVTGAPTDPGAPVTPGIDFTGGTELRVESDMTQQEVEASFDETVISVQGVVGSGDTYVVRLQSSDVQSIRQQAQSADMNVLSSASTAPSFGAGAQQTAVIGLVVAFTGMSLLVFGLFRTFVPSLAVVVSAFSDIIIPLAVMNFIGIKLSLGTVAALLMLIGYSVDSDILLNNHVLRRSGGFYESVYRAMETGITMTLTSIAAMTVMAIVATIFNIDLMADIGIVLVIGLSADLMNTYLLNLSLLRWYKYEGVAR
ncbi:protein translocase subunit secF [Halomicrobium zhouii]|uniref:Protein-export membrane protein SecF n=1 Tax=Halomicrobium zhouii TaxID=767519 RepID=A0A1I6KLT7_9EURY|nr:protein translocase subunit SecF [Halomicrobium zhouii]SFR92159.1 protein translocase subunit secF [Halomicrobium zhouii]